MNLRNRVVILFIVLGLFISFTSCSRHQDEILVYIKGEATPWTHLDVTSSSDRFHFAIVSDNTGSARPGVFEDAVSKLNLIQPQFVVSVGDLIQGKTGDEQEIKQQWEHIDGIIAKLKMPFFFVPGNHDYSNQVMAEIWKTRFGTAYYHFVYRNVLFLCLNSEDDVLTRPAIAILEEQFNYAKKALEENPEVRWTFVFIHKPLWILEKTGKWKDLERILAERRHTVFAGHMHHYAKYERNNGEYYILSTTGGAKERRGVDFGEFDHLVWVTMSDEEPIIANFLLDGIWNEDMRINME